MRRATRTYLRLAAYFCAQLPGADRLVMTLAEIERVTGERLPQEARSSAWWSNDPAEAHARAWLSCGWRVVVMDQRGGWVEFARPRGSG